MTGRVDVMWSFFSAPIFFKSSNEKLQVPLVINRDATRRFYFNHECVHYSWLLCFSRYTVLGTVPVFLIQFGSVFGAKQFTPIRFRPGGCKLKHNRREFCLRCTIWALHGHEKQNDGIGRCSPHDPSQSWKFCNLMKILVDLLSQRIGKNGFDAKRCTQWIAADV